MPETMPSLHALHCFDVAARTGSFTAAAREMSLTHGAVSRQVRLLEEQIGHSLFVRSGRQVVLTANGKALLLATGRAFSSLRDGLAELKRGNDAPLVISCEPTLTLQWLIPRLTEWQSRHPHHHVQVESSGGAIDLARRGVDLAIRRADFPMAKGVHTTTLMTEWMGPVCAPSLAKKVKSGAAVPQISNTTRPTAWSDWTELGGRHVRASRALTFDHFAMSLQAAIAGLGVAMGPYPLVMDSLAADRLVAPFGFKRSKARYVLLSHSAEGQDPRLDGLRTWLLGEAKRARPKSPLMAP